MVLPQLLLPIMDEPFGVSCCLITSSFPTRIQRWMAQGVVCKRKERVYLDLPNHKQKKTDIIRYYLAQKQLIILDKMEFIGISSPSWSVILGKWLGLACTMEKKGTVMELILTQTGGLYPVGHSRLKDDRGTRANRACPAFGKRSPAEPPRSVSRASSRLFSAFLLLTLLVLFAGANRLLGAGKPDPGGIVRLFSTDVARPENSPSWTNPSLDGMRIRPDWSDIQPSNSSTFQWSTVDTILNLGAQYGKSIGMSVAAGVVTPQWVYNAGATKYHLRDGTGLSMPIPWDAEFQTRWFAFVRAMGQRYDGNPALGYIVISGLGQYIETGLAQTSADIAALTALGGPPAWIASAQQIIAVYAEAFPTTPFFITAARPFVNDEGTSALQQVIDWGVATYPGRFGIMNASLNANSTTVYYPNLAIYTYHTTQPVGFQMLCAEDDHDRLGGTLNQALTQGVLLGGKFVEIYQQDADKPSNRTMLAIQGAALKGNLGPRAPTNLHILD